MPFKVLSKSDFSKVIIALEKEYPDAKYYLAFRTPIDLVAAAIISAQTRDEVVNSVTPELFKRFKTAKEYAKADVDELAKYISKVSFAGNKAKNIISACRIIEERYSGKVPNKAEELIELPGIGRKTANTIL
ncbi:MAG: endonuclease III, partial [Candidatus Micrarchaeota archaeon]|nr:endonuclease III [Candidatus Micrarchaeota archaeon]